MSGVGALQQPVRLLRVRQGRRAMLLLALLLLLSRAEAAAGAAAGCTNADSSCPAAIRPVCGSNGRSYSNACVAGCAAVDVTHEGYCQGDRVRFAAAAGAAVHSVSAASSSVAPAAAASSWGAAKEAAAVIPAAVLSRFAEEGFAFRGRVALADLAADASANPLLRQRVRAPKEAGRTVAAAVSAVEAPPEGRVPDRPDALSALSSKAAEPRGMLDVAIVRVDSAGNLYTKTFTYDPRRFSQLVYPPFNPQAAKAADSSSKPAAAAVPPPVAAAAPQQPQVAAKSGAATPRATPAPAPAIAAEAGPIAPKIPAAAAPTAPKPVAAKVPPPLAPAAAGSSASKPAVPPAAKPAAGAATTPAPLAPKAPATPAAAVVAKPPPAAAAPAVVVGKLPTPPAQKPATAPAAAGNKLQQPADVPEAARLPGLQQPQPPAAPVAVNSSSNNSSSSSRSSWLAPSRFPILGGAGTSLDQFSDAVADPDPAEPAGAQQQQPAAKPVPAGGTGEAPRRLEQQAPSHHMQEPAEQPHAALELEVGTLQPPSTQQQQPLSQQQQQPSQAGAPAAGAVGSSTGAAGNSNSSKPEQQQLHAGEGGGAASHHDGVADSPDAAASRQKAAEWLKQNDLLPEAGSAEQEGGSGGDPFAASEAQLPPTPGTTSSSSSSSTGSAAGKDAGSVLPAGSAAAAAPPAAAGNAAAGGGASASGPGDDAVQRLVQEGAAASSQLLLPDGRPGPQLQQQLKQELSSAQQQLQQHQQQQQQQQQQQHASGAPPSGKPRPPCNAVTGLFCRDKILATSPLFGTRTKASLAADQAWLVPQARITSIQIFYNRSSECVRGLEVTYTRHGPAGSEAAIGANSSSSGAASGGADGADAAGPETVVQTLGSPYRHPTVAVKQLRLKPGERIGKVEVWDPKCVRYLRFFTNKGRHVAAGRLDDDAAPTNVTRNRDNGLLVALRGYQDVPVTRAATATKPAAVSAGVLKQVQFVWGAPHCDRNCTPPASAASEASVAVAAFAAEQHDEDADSQQEQSVGELFVGAARRRLQQAQAAAAALLARTELLQAQRALRRLSAAAADAAAEALEPAWDRAFVALSDAAAAADDGADDADADAAGSGHGGGGAAHPAAVQRLLSVIKPDTRVACPVRTFPYEAMGQIKAKASDGGFVCSGGLIGPNRVLTAGHCVWDDRGTQGPFRDLRFTPGQWRPDGANANAKPSSLFGAIDWDYVTLFDAYVNDPDGEGLPFDLAVITLHKPVGSELGWLGMRAEPPPCSPQRLPLTLAGYPGDDPDNPRPGGWAGGCFYDVCDVSYSCSVSITNHTCDSYVGQSGAPMFDAAHYVRAVHTLGVLPGFSTTNGAITIQKFALDNIMGYWKDMDGFTRAPRGGGGSRAAAALGQRGRRS